MRVRLRLTKREDGSVDAVDANESDRWSANYTFLGKYHL